MTCMDQTPTYQEVQSSRCSPFKLMQHSLQQLSLIQSILNCLQYGRCFITTLVVLSTIPTSPSNNPFFYFNQFSPPYITSLLVHKTTPTNPTNNPFLYTSAILASLFLLTTIPITPTKNIFFTIQPIEAMPRAQWVSKCTFFGLTLLCFPRTWTGITALLINDFLSLRLRTLAYCS